MKEKMFSLATVAIFLIAAFNIFAQDQVPAPVYKDGEFWHFRVAEKDFLTQSTRAVGGDYEVFYSGAKVGVKALREEEVQTREAIGNLRRMLHLPDDDDQILQFPLAVGKKWSVSHQSTTKKGKLENVTSEVSVVGMEEVTTPAGTFKAFKIERYETRGEGKTGGRRAEAKQATKTAGSSFIYYYSPDTRSIVKSYSEAKSESGDIAGKREIELLKFGSGGK